MQLFRSFSTKNNRPVLTHLRRIYLYCSPEIRHRTSKKNYTIFIVDDEPNTLESLRIVLEQNGFKVEAFTDPALASNRYVAGLYDLLIVVFTDIGDIIAYRHGLHFCREVNPNRNQ